MYSSYPKVTEPLHFYFAVDNTKGGKRLKRKAAKERQKMEDNIKIYETVLDLLPVEEKTNLIITSEHRETGIWPWLLSGQCK